MVVKRGHLQKKEECKLRGFETRILRRILGPKKDENVEFIPFTQYSQGENLQVRSGSENGRR